MRRSSTASARHPPPVTLTRTWTSYFSNDYVEIVPRSALYGEVSFSDGHSVWVALLSFRG